MILGRIRSYWYFLYSCLAELFLSSFSLWQILNEEVYDLMDPSPPTTYRPDMYVGAYMRPQAPAKTPIQIRESISGGISLAGVTEIEVNSYSEMAKLLEQGSSSRATASTNMNSQSRFVFILK